MHVGVECQATLGRPSGGRLGRAWGARGRKGSRPARRHEIRYDAVVVDVHPNSPVGPASCLTCGCRLANWLSVRVVADALNCTRKLIRRLIKTGQLEAVMVGHVWRIRHVALHTYLAREEEERFLDEVLSDPVEYAERVARERDRGYS